MKFDPEERTIRFAKESLKLCKSINLTIYNKNIIVQVLRSSQSVGANYREANAAASRADFRNKIMICRKELQESAYWFDLLTEENQKNEELNLLKQEVKELILIFNKISYSLKKEVIRN